MGLIPSADERGRWREGGLELIIPELRRETRRWLSGSTHLPPNLQPEFSAEEPPEAENWYSDSRRSSALYGLSRPLGCIYQHIDTQRHN